MLKTLVLAAALVAVPLTTSAFARDPALTDANYATAARCIAFAGMPQLAGDAFDVTALQTAYDAQSGRRSPAARSQARDAERTAQRVGRRSSEALLRVHRDESCSAFVSMGLANNGQTAGSAPSMP